MVLKGLQYLFRTDDGFDGFIDLRILFFTDYFCAREECLEVFLNSSLNPQISLGAHIRLGDPFLDSVEGAVG